LTPRRVHNFKQTEVEKIGPRVPVAITQCREVRFVLMAIEDFERLRRVLTANALNRARRTVVVVPLSTGPTPRPPIVVATPSAGEESVAVCDSVRAINKGRLSRRDGQLAPADLRAVEDGVRAVLEL
jgi:mRNA interferase MazF